MFLTKTKKSPYYWLIYEVDGRRTSVSTKTKIKSEALKFLQTFNIDENPKQKLSKISLTQFTQEYLTYCKSCRSQSYIERSIIPAFNKFTTFIGATDLNNISSRQVDKFVTSINSYSTASAGLYYRTLKAAFSKAVVWEYLKENPFKKIKAPKQVKSLPIFINKEEFQLILNNTKHQFLKDVFITGFYTGMRLGELLNMRWFWIDFNQNLITVKNSNGFTTKNKKERIIPIHSNVEEVLLSIYSNLKKFNDNSFVFYRYPGIKLNNNFVSKSFKKAVRQAGLNDDIHFHTLRHSFASNLVQSGSSLYIVKELLGHQDFSITQIYSHLQQENLNKAVNLL
jgi:site-specific recombinase XerD